jgi:hypothetical protein
MLRADLIEASVWNDCLRFIESPDLLLSAAKQQLHARMAEATRLEEKRQKFQKALYDLYSALLV